MCVWVTLTVSHCDVFCGVLRSFRWYDILATRLVRGAMAEAYSRNTAYRGPFPTSYTVQKSANQLLLSMNVSTLDIRAKNGFEVSIITLSASTIITGAKTSL